VRSNFRVNTSNLEQVQVVKGPASITYGQVEPGGLVDIVTKKRLAGQRIYLEGRVGEFNTNFFLADWSQPIGERVALRVNLSREESDTFRDFFKVDRDAIAVSGRLALSDSTSLALEYEYRDEFRSFDRGSATIPVPGGREIAHRLLDIDISTRFGEPFEEIDTEFEFGSITLEHAFSDNWRVTLIGALCRRAEILHPAIGTIEWPVTKQMRLIAPGYAEQRLAIGCANNIIHNTMPARYIISTRHPAIQFFKSFFIRVVA